MLIIYLFLIMISVTVYQLACFVSHICYMAKIGYIADNIRCKDDLLYLKLRDYEHVIAEIFRRQGYKVQMSDHFGEGGTGIILDGVYYVIARKESYNSLVEIEQAKKLVKHMRDNNIHRGIIITLGDFKGNTKNYCHMHVIKCINGDQLIQMLRSVQALKTRSAFSRNIS